MRIGITYNLKDELSPEAILNNESHEEFDTADTINAICDVFEKKGYTTLKLGGGAEVVEQLKKEKVDFVFNIAEGHRGRNRESHIPSILEMLNIPYSGSDPLTLCLALDKIMAKKIAFQAGIPTPRYSVIRKAEDSAAACSALSYPLMVKPAWEGSSKGIYNSSRVFDKTELKNSIDVLLKKYPEQPILVEEYIAGREITVGVIGNDPPHILGLMEVVNKASSGEDFFYSLEVKRDWKRLVDYVSPPDISSLLYKHITHYALAAFKEFGCRDIARIDFRVSRHERPFLLEINPLPGLSPDYADLVILSGKLGVEYKDLVLSILNHALSRYRIAEGNKRNITGSANG